MVIGGASLTGGLASPLSTWVAAFFLAGLNQMMRVMGLPTALQFVVFGLVIIGGMLRLGRSDHPRGGARPARAEATGSPERRGASARPPATGRDEKGGRVRPVRAITAMASAIDPGGGNMERIKIIGIVATLAMVVRLQ